MKVMSDGLWTVWTTRKRLRLDHTAHSPYFGGVLLAEVALFSVIKWPCFRGSRFVPYGLAGPVSVRQNSQPGRRGGGGSLFDCQKGTFSIVRVQT